MSELCGKRRIPRDLSIVFNLFDAYELRARVFPALLVFLPLYVTGVALGQWSGGWGVAVTVGITGVIPFVYAGSLAVRQLGRAIEQDLWKSWGGPPTTRFLRWSDKTLSDIQKVRAHRAIRERFGVSLSTPDEERNEPTIADGLISEAFWEIRAYLRSRDKDGLWNQHNAEYGFSRNMLGSRMWWLAISIVGSATCGGLLFASNHGALIGGTVLNGGMTAASLVMGWYFLPRMMVTSADSYAESAISSFLTLAASSEPGGEI